MIYEHLVSNDLSTQSIIKTRESRDSVNKARGGPRIDLAEKKNEDASDARTRKADALTKDINELKLERRHPRKVTRNFEK